MPRYAYECFQCGHSVEKIEGWHAEPRQPCTECDALMQRIPSPPAIVFKGSGWYSTDNRKSSWKTRSDEDGEPGGDGDSDGSPSDNGADAGDKAPAAASSNSD